jgi:tRNA dimethylallyltransferase
VARWRQLALTEIAAAHIAGSLPILVGGTGLYLRALMRGLAPVPDIPSEIRVKAAALYQELGGAEFRQQLAALDPEAAARLPSGDRARLTRAWEVVHATGRPLGEWQSRSSGGAPYRFATLLLMPPRDALYAACDARLAAMVAAGALDEAARLAARQLDPDLPAMKALGVPELLRHLRGEIPLDVAVALVQRSTRRYAKRQVTWFRHQIVADLTFAEQFSESLLRRSRHFVDQFLLTVRS